MTKKEQAAVDATLLKYKLRAALSWTPKVELDVAPPTYGSAVMYTTGWVGHSWGDNYRVEQGWSGSNSHGEGDPPKERYSMRGSQNPRHLFSTRLLALKAVRNQVEANAAKLLMRIDAEIEAEEAKPDI